MELHIVWLFNVRSHFLKNVPISISLNVKRKIDISIQSLFLSPIFSAAYV